MRRRDLDAGEKAQLLLSIILVGVGISLAYGVEWGLASGGALLFADYLLG